jgi:hypothetical protein
MGGRPIAASAVTISEKPIARVLVPWRRATRPTAATTNFN